MNETKGAMYLSEGYPHRCTLGKRSYAADKSPQIYFYEGCESWLHVGSYVAFGPQVKVFVGGEHHTEWVSTYPFPDIIDGIKLPSAILTHGDIVIGSDVWIGGYATILSGVTIGHGAVIGAGAVIAKDVPPYTVVVGNPARIIRRRFTDAQITQLLAIAWWNWEEEKIECALPLLMSNNIDAFIQYANIKEEERDAVSKGSEN